MSINLPPGVSLHPNSSTRNRVQPTGDFIPFSVRAAVGQTNDLFVAYASDGTTKLTRLTSDGTISSPSSAFAGSEHFGLGASAAAAGALALGGSAAANFQRAIAVGSGAGVTATDAVAVGAPATAALQAVAIGSLAAAGTNAVAIGRSATGSADNAVAIGVGSTGSFQSAVAVGIAATASQQSCLALGAIAQATNVGSTSLGALSAATLDGATAVGSSTSAAFSYSLAFGAGAATTARQQWAVGAANDTTRAITDAYFGGGVVSTVPLPFVLHGTGGSGANVAGASLTFAGGQGTGSAVGGDLIFKSSLADGSGSSLNALHELMRLSNVGVLSLTQLTSIQDRTAFDLTPSWATSTDASRKARAIFNVYDTAAREAIRLEASGSAAMLGVLGSAAVAQQASTVDLKDAWCGFGFQVNGGATPLNLDGGSMTAANYATAITTVTANYAMVPTDGTVYADAASGAFSVTLPTPIGAAGRTYTVKKVDTGSNAVTVLPNASETLDGSASVALAIPETTLGFQSDNANWRIV